MAKYEFVINGEAVFGEGETRREAARDAHRKAQKNAQAEERSTGRRVRDLAVGGAHTALSGASLGLSQHLGAAGGAAAALSPGGLSPAEGYQQQLDAIRRSMADFRESAGPVASTGLEMGAGLAGGGLAGGALKPAKTAVGGVLQALGVGAGAGAVEGAATAPSLADAPEDAVRGAASGAAFGLAGPVVGRALTGAGQGLKSLYHLATETADQRAQRMLRDVLEESGLSPAVFTQKMQELGPDAVVADLSPQLQRKLRALVAKDPNVEAMARGVLQARARGSRGRITAKAQETLGVDDRRIAQTIDEIDEARRTFAREQYGPIYDAPLEPDDDFAELLKRPSIAKGYREARLMAADAGETMQEIVDESGAVVATPRLADIDHMKQGVDAVIESNTDPVTGKVNARGRAAIKAKRALLDWVEQADPDIARDYAQARSTYAGFSALEGAANHGRRILNEDADWSGKRVQDMGESEFEAFKIGAANAIRDEVERVIRDTNDPSARAKLSAPFFRRRLRQAFPDEASFEEFVQQLERERAKFETRNIGLAGSRTAALAEDIDDVSAESMDVEGDWRQAAVKALRAAWGMGAPKGMTRAQEARVKFAESVLTDREPTRALNMMGGPELPWNPGTAGLGAMLPFSEELSGAIFSDPIFQELERRRLER